MNERGKSGDAFWKRRRVRQMPEMGSAEGDAKDSRPHAFFAKDVAEEDVPARRTLRGADVSHSEEPIKRLEKTEGTTLEQRHPDWPEMKVKFYFSSHISDKDMAELPELMEDADIYIFEGRRAKNSNRTRFFQATADGLNLDGTPLQHSLEGLISAIEIEEETVPGSVLETQIRAIHKTGVIVGNIDLRTADQTDHDFDSLTWSKSKNFYKTLQRYEDYEKSWAKLEEEREAIISNRFEEELEEIFKAHPELKKKPVTVLISMGVAHESSLSNKFEQKGITIESVVSEISKDKKPLSGNVLRDTNEPSQELVARGYLEYLLLMEGLDSLWSDNPSTSLLYDYAASLSTHFTIEEIKKIHDLSLSRKDGNKKMIEGTNTILQNKNLGSLPTTNEELLVSIGRMKEDIVRRSGML